MLKRIIIAGFIFLLNSNFILSKPFLDSLIVDLGAGVSLPMGEKTGLGGSATFGLQSDFLNYYLGANYYTYQITDDDIKNDAAAQDIGTGPGHLFDVFIRLEYPIPVLLTKYKIRLYGGLDFGESYFQGIYKDSDYIVDSSMLGYMGSLYASVGYSVTQQTEIMFRLGGTYRLIDYELDTDEYPKFSGVYAQLGLRFYSGDLFGLSY